jgi:hypothetical protein
MECNTINQGIRTVLKRLINLAYGEDVFVWWRTS